VSEIVASCDPNTSLFQYRFTKALSEAEVFVNELAGMSQLVSSIIFKPLHFACSVAARRTHL
jgi:hypothetical protein